MDDKLKKLVDIMVKKMNVAYDPRKYDLQIFFQNYRVAETFMERQINYTNSLGENVIHDAEMYKEMISTYKWNEYLKMAVAYHMINDTCPEIIGFDD